MAPVVATLAQRTAVDHAHKRAGDNRNLGRATCGTPHQRQGKIVDEIAESAVLQKGAEQDEQENIGRGDPYADPEQPLTAPEHMLDNPVPAVAGVTESSGNQISEEIIGKKDQRQSGKVSHNPARHFKTDHQSYGSHHIVYGFKPASAQRDVRIVENKIAEGENARANAQRVIERGSATLTPLATQRGIQQKRERQQKKNMYRPQGDGIQSPEG